MPKDMSLKIARIKVKILVGEIRMPKVCPANFSIKLHVCTPVLMKREAFFIGTSVCPVLQEMAKCFLSQRRIVRTNTRLQKTSRLVCESTHWHTFWSESGLK